MKTCKQKTSPFRHELADKAKIPHFLIKHAQYGSFHRKNIDSIYIRLFQLTRELKANIENYQSEIWEIGRPL